MKLEGSLIALISPLSLLVVGLGGCVDDRAEIVTMERNSHFEETGGGRYRFTATMNAAYPADDPAAEALRKRWLNQDLALSNRCSCGANVTDREIVHGGKDPVTGAPVGTIVYQGDCTV
jgi:hypothetical protein